MTKPLSAPPTLDGYEVVRHLSGGGFADVYLYEQKSLGRQVAVKVLRANASSPEVHKQFNAESTLMAALSDHQNIVTIHDAAVASDGRPYLVMAYYPGTLSQRYRAGQMTVSEVLAIGVELAGAVETIHRQDILHRDIKPANVLTTKGGRAALTDFGISVSSIGDDRDSSVGMSIPWSPPEIINGDADADQRADIYSLTATIYTLLARRAPYESSTAPNDELAMIPRIKRSSLPPTGRPDVPPALERLLAKGLARDPDRRFSSALELARALQQIEREIGGKITEVDVLDEDPVGAATAVGINDGHTRIRRLVTIHPQPELPQDRTTARVRPTAPAPAATISRAPGTPSHLVAGYLEPAPGPSDTLVRTEEELPAAQDQPVARKPKRPMLIGIGALTVIAAIATAVVLTGGSQAPNGVPTTETVPSAGGSAAIDLDMVAAPQDLVGVAAGADSIFRWSNPAPESGDQYFWRRTDPGADTQRAVVEQESVTVSGVADACIEVILQRSDGRASPSAQACVGD